MEYSIKPEIKKGNTVLFEFTPHQGRCLNCMMTVVMPAMLTALDEGKTHYINDDGTLIHGPYDLRKHTIAIQSEIGMALFKGLFNSKENEDEE